MADVFIVRRGGYTRYSTLTVTTEEPTLQSAPVTVEVTDKESGKVDTQTRTLVNGSTKFNLKYLAEYTVTCGEATSNVDVQSYADYTADIALWDGTLFAINNGEADQYIKITGGWNSFGTNAPDSKTTYIDNDGMHVYGNSGSNYGWITADEIDVSGYSKLSVLSTQLGKLYIGLTNGNRNDAGKVNTIEQSKIADTHGSGSNTSPSDLELDIPSGTTKCRVYVRGSNNTTTPVISAVKLLKA